MGEQTIHLTQHVLGMNPYTLIELGPASDGSGEPSLHIEAGGGAEEQPLYMPLLAITESVAQDGNPLPEMLRDVARQHRSTEAVAAITEIVTQINDEWLPFVFEVGS